MFSRLVSVRDSSQQAFGVQPCWESMNLLTRSIFGILERDSTKDEAVVFIFIFATAGLLAWAAMKPWIGRWLEVRVSKREITICLQQARLG